jgi:2-dehydropantoate 2-reductase
MEPGNTVATVTESGTGIGAPLGVHRMHVAILGAGAMGGYDGARLANAGEDVVFVARGATLQALKSHGLRVKTADVETIVRVTAVGQTDAVGPIDLVLFCVKSYDTAAAASLGSLVTPQTLVLTLQNGLDHVETMASSEQRSIDRQTSSRGAEEASMMLANGVFRFSRAVIPPMVQQGGVPS